MAEVVSLKQIHEGIEFVKSKVCEIDKELHSLRDDFEDTHLTEQDRKAIAKALKEEQGGKTISSKELQKQLGL